MDRFDINYTLVHVKSTDQIQCDTIMLEGKRVALTQKMKETFSKSCETLAGMGERVLGFVHLDLDPSHFPEGFQFSTEGDKPNFPLDRLCLMSTIDPPRPLTPMKWLSAGVLTSRWVFVLGKDFY